jgi:hypothetical protein
VDYYIHINSSLSAYTTLSPCQNNSIPPSIHPSTIKNEVNVLLQQHAPRPSHKRLRTPLHHLRYRRCSRQTASSRRRCKYRFRHAPAFDTYDERAMYNPLPSASAPIRLFLAPRSYERALRWKIARESLPQAYCLGIMSAASVA